MAKQSGESDIGVKLFVEGEAEFKKSLREMNENFKNVKSEMEVLTSAYDKNDTSLEALTSRGNSFNKQIEAQKSTVDLLKTALDKAKTAVDENGEACDKDGKKAAYWQSELNKAQITLNKLSVEAEKNIKEISKLGEAENSAGKEIEKLGNEAKNSSEKLHNHAETLNKVGSAAQVAGGIIGGVAVAAGAAAVKMGAEVVKAFGELEQNIGGSEVVFGEFAQQVQQIGEDAYKNLGASQSEYLATANKMGALFQGTGLDMQTSFELTTQAMQRAADVASVMGIDTSFALESIAGAAKGNFSMMDNLGVAMNATNIEAYALANGLDFAWKSATQAEKAQVAMQMFFEQTEQYAGNFAREATETISGSLGLLKSSTESFIAGLGNADADMHNLTQNMVDAFGSVVENVAPIVKNMAEVLPEATQEIVKAFGDIAPEIMETAPDIIMSFVDGIMEAAPDIIESGMNIAMKLIDGLLEKAPEFGESALDLIGKLGNAVTEKSPEILAKLGTLIGDGLKYLGENFGDFLDAGLKLAGALLDGLGQGLANLGEGLVEGIGSAVLSAFEKSNADLKKQADEHLQSLFDIANKQIKFHKKR